MSSAGRLLGSAEVGNVGFGASLETKGACGGGSERVVDGPISLLLLGDVGLLGDKVVDVFFELHLFKL